MKNKPIAQTTLFTCLMYLVAFFLHTPELHAQKVAICHIPPGNPENSFVMEVNANAVSAHLAHGDNVGPCGGEEEAVVPFAVAVAPNPYPEETDIFYTLQQPGHVSLKVYNQFGTLIETIAHEQQDIGDYSYQFSATHQGLTCGVYYLRCTIIYPSEQIIETTTLVEQ